VLLEPPPADEAAGEGYERVVEFGAAFPSHGEPFELVEQGEGLLDDVVSLPMPWMFGAPLRDMTGRIRRLRSSSRLGLES
jgi:hypothetical protein